MGVEIKFTNEGKTDKFKLENLSMIIQIIISFITIGLLIYGYNSYKFEKKVEYTNLFITKLENSLNNYQLFLLSENVKVNLYKKSEFGLQEGLNKIYEIENNNTENYLSFRNYLNLSGDISNKEYIESLDNEFGKIQIEFGKVSKKMFDEVNQSGLAFNYFSSGTLNSVNTLDEKITNFSNNIINNIK